MKAAEALALRGRSVTLYERADHLGGQVGIAGQAPYLRNLTTLVDDLSEHIGELGVEILLGEEGSPQTVNTGDIDGVVVATGATPEPAQVSLSRTGLDLTEADAIEIAHGWDVIQRHGVDLDGIAGAPVVVVDELGNRCTVAVVEALLAVQADVLLVTRRNGLLHDLEPTLDWDLVAPRLMRDGLEYRLNSWIAADKRDSRCLAVNDALSGRPTDHVADAALLVHVCAPRPNDAPYFAFRDSALTTLRVGDCVAPRGLDEAIYEGFMVGTDIAQQRDVSAAEWLATV
jgi:hypothetical protein